MIEERLPDLVLTGAGIGKAGSYNEVRMEGMCKINGPLTARLLKGNGLTKLEGDARIGEMDTDGKITVDGNLEAESYVHDGMLSVRGNLRCGRFVLNGMASIKEDCDVETFSGDGAFKIGGLLSAGTVDFSLHGKCKAEEIGARSIVIRSSSRSVTDKLLTGGLGIFKPRLKAKLIEGESIHLEYTEAELVTGGKVTIGPGCDIDLVEYRDELTVHPDSRVGKKVHCGD